MDRAASVSSSNSRPSSRDPWSQTSSSTSEGRRVRDRLERGVAVRCRTRFISFVLQHAGHKFANVEFVIDDEDIERPSIQDPVSSQELGAVGRSVVGRFLQAVVPRRFERRPGHRGDRSASSRSLPPPGRIIEGRSYRNVPRRSWLHDREPQPGAARSGGHVRFDQPVCVPQAARRRRRRSRSNSARRPARRAAIFIVDGAGCLLAASRRSPRPRS